MRPPAPLLAVALLPLLIAACGRPPAPASAPPPLDARAFARHVEILASDAFEGRAPGTAGEQRTIDYVIAEFEAAGLQPGGDDGWLQQVPAIEMVSDPGNVLHIDVGDQRIAFGFGDDIVIGSGRGEETVALDDSPIVFVGYGIHAPEADWNDYVLDVAGKTVVMLVNDPGYALQDPAVFSGRRMTYYGRWTYKLEEAARQGAAAAFIIHDDGGAGYGWNVVRSGWLGRAQFDLPARLDPSPRLPVRGWLSAPAAERLFAAAGHDLAALRQAAAQRGFTPVALDARAHARVQSRVRQIESHNIIGHLPGAEAADEAVLLLAHWDHFGINPELEGDPIISGAIDNATGVAAIIEIARAMSARPTPPRRSVYFAAVTLEESGLLGSRMLAAQPPLPPAQIVAALNFDALDPALERDRLRLVGYGASELDQRLAPIAESLGMPLADEPEPEKGLYFRSDHFALAQVGVPALVSGLIWSDDYTAHHYHQPSDVYDPNWELDGVMREIEAVYRLGVALADDDSWPQWREGNPFRSVREASRGGGGFGALTPPLQADSQPPARPPTPASR